MATEHPTTTIMFSSSLLLLPVPSMEVLSDPSDLLDPVRIAATETTDRLTIFLLTPLFRRDTAISVVDHWDDIQLFLGKVYGEAVRVAQGQGRVLFEVDVVIDGLTTVSAWEPSYASWDALWTIEGLDAPLPRDLKVSGSTARRTVPISAYAAPAELATSSRSHLDAQAPSSLSSAASYPVVALGGSFDHLHAGHKILLTMAILLATRKLIAGVSDDALLTKKAFASELQSISERMAIVRRFCELIRPDLEYEIVGIHDVYGPTATESDIQALVLSQETVAGGEAIAKCRKAASLSQLDVFIISVISHTTDEDFDHGSAEGDARLKKAKMSSTFIREWLSKRRAAEVDQKAAA